MYRNRSKAVTAKKWNEMLRYKTAVLASTSRPPSPKLLIKTFQYSIRILHIFLRLLSHIKYRAILTRAQNILRYNVISFCIISGGSGRHTWCREPWHLWHCVHSRANRTCNSEVVITCFWYSSETLGRQLLHTAPSDVIFISTILSQNGHQGVLGTLLFARSAVLQPRQVTVLTANFMRPPTVGVAICIDLVWSPDTVDEQCVSH